MPIDPELCKHLVDQAPDAVVFADLDGVIRGWNDAATAVFGHAPDEAIGQRLDLIVPERFQEAHWAGFHRAIGDGDTKYRGQSFPTRSQRKDGTAIYVELSFAIVKNDAGTVLG